MAKLGLITIRYGTEINGGAEYHCRMLAERFAHNHEVDVLTTTIKRLNHPEDVFLAGESVLNKVNIRRFDTQEPNSNLRHQFNKKSKIARKIRRTIYRFGLAKSIFSKYPVWKYKLQEETELFKQHDFYSSDLLQFIEQNHQLYDVLLFFTYENPLTQLGSLIAPQKTILIPTAHLESMLFKSSTSVLFHTVRYIAFNTEAEQDMCLEIFSHQMAEHGVIGVAVEIAKSPQWAHVQDKFKVTKPYLLYCGRITQVKINNFLDYFIQFKKEHAIDLQLVLTGENELETVAHEDIIYAGFVSENEKIALIENCFAVVNPSLAESLSLIALEAMTLGKPVIGNQHSTVMVEHERRSHGAVQCYRDYASFKSIVLNLINQPEQLKTIAEKALEYVHSNYNWNIIIAKFEGLFKKIIK
ncbi:glycosyltransferase family 4 protein [Sphingobacterium sp. HJSM2_6]|uniref:glycosyltransferase family 4 protein n=1 Tax=Sphingobacterium sp. HJSM2_6 TaxID=3366264 RepID=UPI003BBABD3F